MASLWCKLSVTKSESTHVRGASIVTVRGTEFKPAAVQVAFDEEAQVGQAPAQDVFQPKHIK